MRCLLLCSPVCLRCAKAKLLLLLSRAKRLAKALVEKVGEDFGVSQILLLIEVCRSNPATVAPEGTGADGVAHLPSLLLLVLLVQKASGALQNSAEIWRHVLINLIGTQFSGVYRLSAASHVLVCGLLEGLRASQSLLRPKS